MIIVLLLTIFVAKPLILKGVFPREEEQLDFPF